MAGRFAAQIPVLEDKVNHLDNKVLDTLTEAYAKELNLERVTKANGDYKSLFLYHLSFCISLNVYSLLLL
jgi:hypothetical protein